MQAFDYKFKHLNRLSHSSARRSRRCMCPGIGPAPVAAPP